MSDSLVTVIIPTYNHAHFLPQALQSLQAQTHQNWEAIVVNNFSTDDTEQVVAGFGDSRVRLENFANHGVIAAARNHGMRMAQGQYLAFLDSDDHWESEKLAQCVQLLDAGSADLVCHAERWLGDGVDKFVQYGPQAAASFDALLYHGNCLSTSAVVVRLEWSQRVGGFTEATSMITAEDYHLWLKLAQAGARITFIDTMLGTYRIHAGNQSRSVLRNMEATQAVVESFWADMPANSWREQWRRRCRRGSLAYSGARALQNIREHVAAWPWFFRALCLSPLDPRIMPAMLMNALWRRF